MDSKPLVKIGGLYEKTSAKGTRYFTGRLGAAKLVVFANRDKKEDKDPDFFMYVQEPQEATSTGQRPLRMVPKQEADIAF